MAEDSLELLSPPPESWDYRHARPHPVYMVLWIEPMASCMPGKHYSKRTASPATVNFTVVMGGRASLAGRDSALYVPSSKKLVQACEIDRKKKDPKQIEKSMSTTRHTNEITPSKFNTSHSI